MQGAVSFRSILEFAGNVLPVDNPELDKPLGEDSLAVQEFQTPGVLSLPDKQKEWPDLIISGVPGSGKTQLALALIMVTALRDRRMIFFAAPTRPLAQENFDRLRTLCRGLLPEDDIVLSTGDQCMDDWRIYRRQARICCTVFEKLLSMLMQDGKVGEDAGLAVVDETHMFNQAERGVRLDMLLAALTQRSVQRTARVAVLTVMEASSCELLGCRLRRHHIAGAIPPLRLSSGKRPQAVEHRLLVHGNHNANKEYRHLGELALRFYGRGTSLHLDEKNLGQLEEDVCAVVSRADTTCQDSQPIPVRLVDELSKRFPRLLVVNTNIELLHRAAMLLCQERKKGEPDVYSAGFIRKLDDLRRNDIISPSLQNTLTEMAARGVFIHTGKMHTEVRHAVEDAFREAGGSHWVLFATTTLAYGVNLRLDCVVLTVKFVHANGEPCIDAVEFHNIMGRAGRFADREKGLALVLVPGNQERSPADLIPFGKSLCNCYRQLELQVHEPNPLTTDVAPGNKDQHSLFLYALKLAEPDAHSEMIPVRDIARLLKCSVHALAVKAKMNELINLTRRALDSMADLSCLGVRLLEREENEGKAAYRITPAGMALLESGGSLSDAHVMGAWLELVQERFRVEERVRLPLIWLVALLSTPKVQGDIEQIFGRSSPQHQPKPFCDMLLKRIREQGFSPQQAEDFYNRFEDVLQVQMRRLSCINSIIFDRDCGEAEQKCRIDRVLSGEFDNADDELLFPDPARLRYASEKRMVRCLRVMLALWDWTSGKTLQHVERALGLADGERYQIRFFPPRLVERVSWHSVLLSGFFGGTRLLTAEETGSLVRLGRRLRTGLRDQQIPSLGRDISRYSVVHTNQATPEARAKMQSVRQDYYQNQSLSFCSWVRAVGDVESAGIVERALDEVLRPEGEVGTYLAALEELWPHLNWRSALCESGMDNNAFRWACLALAVLLKHGILPEKMIGDELPASVDDILPLLDRQRVSSRLFGGLVAVDTPVVARKQQIAH